MDKVNNVIFIDSYRKLIHPLTAVQLSGLNQLLFFLQNDVDIIDVRWSSYILATIKLECGDTWQPIEEMPGNRTGRAYDVPDPITKQRYYGRGYVQTTWKDNYKQNQIIYNKYHPKDKINLLDRPELLLIPKYAYWLMSYCMRNGSYTGVGLKKYISGSICDYVNARRIINGLDKAKEIADNASEIELLLREALIKP